jgi:sarcosine oxidase subunit beta
MAALGRRKTLGGGMPHLLHSASLKDTSMKPRYSVFSLARNAMNYHKDWERAWRSPTPKPEYDAVIVGAGGHGLATAYYLAKNHKMTNIAVVEKGWLGGGNTGRNTSIIRSNYLQDASIAIYELARSLYEDLSQELNFNMMFSPRGVMMLCQTEHEFRAFKRTAHADRLAGLDCRMITPAEVKEIVPIVNDAPDCRYPILGAYYQPRGGTGRHDAVAWGYARGADGLGVDIIQNCEVTGINREGGKVTGLETTRARSLEDRRSRRACLDHHADGGSAHADRKPVPAGAGLGTDQAGHRLRGDGQHGARLYQPVRQGRAGGRRRHRSLQ